MLHAHLFMNSQVYFSEIYIREEHTWTAVTTVWRLHCLRHISIDRKFIFNFFWLQVTNDEQTSEENTKAEDEEQPEDGSTLMTSDPEQEQGQKETLPDHVSEDSESGDQGSETQDTTDNVSDNVTNENKEDFPDRVNERTEETSEQTSKRDSRRCVSIHLYLFHFFF